MLPGLVVAGVGIGLANPALAAAALRVVDPGRTGMASGISNTFRIGGVAFGVAALGALLENRIASSLAGTLGRSGRELANTVASAGTRPLLRNPGLAHAGRDAFVTGLGDVLLIGALVVVAGAVVGFTLLREPRPVREAVTEPAA
jgi:hypothetical protein